MLAPYKKNWWTFIHNFAQKQITVRQAKEKKRPDDRAANRRATISPRAPALRTKCDLDWFNL